MEQLAGLRRDLRGLRHLLPHLGGFLACVVVVSCSGRTPLIPGQPTQASLVIFQEEVAVSSRGTLAYHDLGVRCVTGPDSYMEDAALEGLYVMDPKSGTSRLVLHGGELPAWSPDGSRLAFVVNLSYLVTANADGSGAQVVATGPLIGYPSWSPDGSRLAFESDGVGTDRSIRVWVVGSDGSNPHAIALPDTESYIEPCWGRTGGRLYAAKLDGHEGRYSTIVEIDTAGHEVRDLHTGGVMGRRPCVSWDGKWIAYEFVALTGGPTIWAVSQDGSAKRQLTGDPAQGVAWFPGDTSIAYTALEAAYPPDRGTIWLKSLVDGKAGSLTTRWPEDCRVGVAQGGPVRTPQRREFLTDEPVRPQRVFP